MKKQYYIPCLEVDDFDSFVEVINREFIEKLGGFWNGNLDAFNDYLSWDSNYEIIIGNSSVCRRAMGHVAMAARLEALLLTCHPANRHSVRKQLADAQEGMGPTLYDLVLSITKDNADYMVCIEA